MDFTFPEKFVQAARYFDHYVGGDLENTDKLDNDRKLLFYALRMQAEQGPCCTPAPAFWHITERYKHTAWSQLRNMSNYEAMVLFVRHFEEVLTADQPQKEVIWMEKVKELSQLENGNVGSSADLVPESEWDDDLLQHRTAKPENVAFLASQVMLARRRLALAEARAPPSAAAPEERRSLPSHSPPPVSPASAAICPTTPPLRSEQAHLTDATSRLPTGPPVNPWRYHDPQARPPVRLSSQAMAAAAARAASAAAEPLSGQAAPTATQRSSSGWGSWLGW